MSLVNQSARRSWRYLATWLHWKCKPCHLWLILPRLPEHLTESNCGRGSLIFPLTWMGSARLKLLMLWRQSGSLGAISTDKWEYGVLLLFLYYNHLKRRKACLFQPQSLQSSAKACLISKYKCTSSWRVPSLLQDVLELTIELPRASALINNCSYQSQSIPLKFISHLFSFPSGRHPKLDFLLEIKSRCNKLNHPLKMMSTREKFGCNPPPLLTVYLKEQLRKITPVWHPQFFITASRLSQIKEFALYVNKLLVW